MCFFSSDLLTPILYLVILVLFVFFVNAIQKRNRKMYDDAAQQQKIVIERQKESLERQKESVELLKEIRDLLKNKSQ